MDFFTPDEKNLIDKGRCFTLKLVGPNAPALPVVWGNYFHTTSSKGCHGLTRFGSSQADTMVYLFDVFPHSEHNLVAMNQIGSTTCHEFHHYWTNSKDDDSPTDPHNIYDDPSLENLRIALSTVLTGNPPCTLQGETAPIKNQAQALACECQIKFWNSSL